MDKHEIYRAIGREGAVVVVRGESVEQGIRTAEACCAGGMHLIEVTFTLPHADEVIRELAQRIPDAVVGAGTVLDAATARIAILAGAQFVVSPMLDEEILRTCNRYGVLAIPGVSTPTEALRALEAGADLVKLFPGDVHRPSGLKALRAPYPQLRIMPTGGVSADNVAEWFAAGAYAVGAGSSVTAGAKKGDYAQVTQDCRAFVERVERAKKGN